MNKVDWSYLKYPEHSYCRIYGRRNEAWELASRIYNFSLDKMRSNRKKFMYMNAYIKISMGESNRVYCNNWRKLHGLPMKRRIIN